MMGTQTHKQKEALGLGLIGLQPVEDVSPFGTTSLSWESGWPLIRTGAAFAAAAAASHESLSQSSRCYSLQSEPNIESGIQDSSLFELVSSGQITMEALLTYPIDWLRLAQKTASAASVAQESSPRKRTTRTTSPPRKRRRRVESTRIVDSESVSHRAAAAAAAAAVTAATATAAAASSAIATALRRRSTISEFLNYSPLCEEPPMLGLSTSASPEVQIHISSPTPNCSRSTTPRAAAESSTSRTPSPALSSVSPSPTTSSSASSTLTTPSPSPEPPSCAAGSTSSLLPTSSLLRRRYLKHVQSQGPVASASTGTATATVALVKTSTTPMMADTPHTTTTTTMTVAPLDIPQSLNIQCPKLNVKIRVEKIAEIKVPVLKRTGASAASVTSSM